MRVFELGALSTAIRPRHEFANPAILARVHVEAHIHGRPKIGETCSGDAGIVLPLDGATWVMLVDGLGHGPKAHEAAMLALDEAGKFDAQLSVDDALMRLHDRLRGTRGAAASLARFDAEGATLAGIGNVEIRGLGGFDMRFAPASGIIGGRMRRPRPVRVDLPPLTKLLFYTDGIVRRTAFESFAALDGAILCSALIEHHSHLHDDATVIHVTYLRSSPR